MLIVAVYALPMKNAVRMHIFFKKINFLSVKRRPVKSGPSRSGLLCPSEICALSGPKKNKKKHLLNHFFANHGRYLAADDSSKPTTTTVLMSRFLANHL